MELVCYPPIDFSFELTVTDAELLDFVNRKLAHGRHRIWADVQSRVKTYILSTDLSSFQYDDFISILDIVKRLVNNVCTWRYKSLMCIFLAVLR